MTWLSVTRGDAPLIVTIPHSGTDIPEVYRHGLTSLWLARKDADWYVDKLYDFATELGATIVRTAISRAVIDVNRDPSGASLYPGQATTELCPTISFDGEPLYQPGVTPDIDSRRLTFFDPYHQAIAAEIERLRARHGRVVLYDAHSIRSEVPRLFEGALPHCNIGSNRGASCDPALTAGIEAACEVSEFSHILNGRFVGGWTTRRYGNPTAGVHAVQMELAQRGYLDEPATAGEANWPPPYEPARAAPMRKLLTAILRHCLTFARSPS